MYMYVQNIQVTLRDNGIYSLSNQVRDERFEGKFSEACKIQ